MSLFRRSTKNVYRMLMLWSARQALADMEQGCTLVIDGRAGKHMMCIWFK